MAVLFGYHRAFSDHDPGSGHPESKERLLAVRDGLVQADLGEKLIEFSPRQASRDELERVHGRGLVEEVEQASRRGGAMVDADTVISSGSFDAVRHAAGAGLDAADRLERGEAQAAFLALRPPGHHACTDRSMGFCLFNSVAITAAALADRGERVLIVDWDAHHGNGTQEIFWDSPDVMFVSFHQYPLYPGTGAVHDIGGGAGRGATINLPFPAGTTGDAYRLAFDTLVVPAVEQFAPTWVLVSAGFDAHRRDPLTDLGLSAGDFADLTTRSADLAPPGRRIFFLEGGYDRQGVQFSSASTIAALAGVRYRPEPASDGADIGALQYGQSPAAVIAAARALHAEALGQ